MKIRVCLVYGWEEIRDYWSQYLVGSLLILITAIGLTFVSCIIWEVNISKKNLISSGFDKAKLEKFAGMFQHIDYTELENDEDCRKFYKKFYNE